MITREKFVEATGREPVNDDLERCNCPHAGEFGHSFCGWNAEVGQPNFLWWKPAPFKEGQGNL